MAEDKLLGDYRWLLVRAPDNHEVSLNLEAPEPKRKKLLWDARRRSSLTGLRKSQSHPRLLRVPEWRSKAHGTGMDVDIG